MTRTYALSLGKNEGARRRDLLDGAARQAGSEGQRGPGYTSLNVDIADAFSNEPELVAAMLNLIILLKSVDLADEDREHLLTQIADLKAQIVAAGLISD